MMFGMRVFVITPHEPGRECVAKEESRADPFGIPEWMLPVGQRN